MQKEFQNNVHRQTAWPLLVIACITIASTFFITQSRFAQNAVSLISRLTTVTPERATALRQKLLALPFLKRLCNDLASDYLLYIAPEPTGITPPAFRSNCRNLTEQVSQNSSGIYLPKLSRLSIPAADQFGGCSGIVDLSGLTSIKLRAAKALAGKQKLLCLKA